MFNLST